MIDLNSRAVWCETPSGSQLKTQGKLRAEVKRRDPAKLLALPELRPYLWRTFLSREWHGAWSLIDGEQRAVAELSDRLSDLVDLFERGQLWAFAWHAGRRDGYTQGVRDQHELAACNDQAEGPVVLVSGPGVKVFHSFTCLDCGVTGDAIALTTPSGATADPQCLACMEVE